MTATAQRAAILGLSSHARGKKSSPSNAGSREAGRGAPRREPRRPAREGGGKREGTTPASGGFGRSDWLAILLLVAACVVVYGNTIGNQFVWDDRKQILEN